MLDHYPDEIGGCLEHLSFATRVPRDVKMQPVPEQVLRCDEALGARGSETPARPP